MLHVHRNCFLNIFLALDLRLLVIIAAAFCIMCLHVSAPPGYLMYFREIEGRVKSFNYPSISMSSGMRQLTLLWKHMHVM
jgi:hypothetical protein